MDQLPTWLDIQLPNIKIDIHILGALPLQLINTNKGQPHQHIGLQLPQLIQPKNTERLLQPLGLLAIIIGIPKLLQALNKLHLLA